MSVIVEYEWEQFRFFPRLNLSTIAILLNDIWISRMNVAVTSNVERPAQIAELRTVCRSWNRLMRALELCPARKRVEKTSGTRGPFCIRRESKGCSQHLANLFLYSLLKIEIRDT